MSWNQAKNLLCIRLDTIGDVLMTTPAFRALKTPDRQLTLLTSSAGSAIAPLIPELDHTIVYDSPWLKATAPRETPRPEYDMIDLLRQHKFDGAIIFTVYSQNPLPSAFLCYMAEIPLRLAHCHENPYQLLTDWIKDPEPDRGIRHEVQRQLDLVAQIGATTENQRLSIRVHECDRDRVSQRLASLNLPGRWVVMHTGATAPSRRYSIEQFAIVADQLILEHDYAVIFTGTTLELDIVAQIQAKMQANSHSLVCQLSLGELTALIELAPVLISNNTAPAHLAAAVGTPVADLYALTNPQHTPWQVPHRLLFQDVPCKYCYKSICPEGHHHCLAQVAPETVVKATCELLEESAQMLEISA
ncbi:MAG: glycosyltransferase family 9 protein [Phormidium tanganyikae FI6-MK23]|jgi:lipopolysaccharide heptosyltransferase II|nr:glycosyltransferase family 9 protein [Phormidium tanganyikae FI6-MK23]